MVWTLRASAYPLMYYNNHHIATYYPIAHDNNMSFPQSILLFLQMNLSREPASYYHFFPIVKLLLFNSLTSLKEAWCPTCISFSVIVWMSNSNSINIITIQYHFAYIYEVVIPFKWSERRKISFINQSISIILFIINSFDSTVYLSPARAPIPRVIDWSRIKSHSSISQSVILSNTIFRQ